VLLNMSVLKKFNLIVFYVDTFSSQLNYIKPSRALLILTKDVHTASKCSLVNLLEFHMCGLIPHGLIFLNAAR